MDGIAYTCSKHEQDHESTAQWYIHSQQYPVCIILLVCASGLFTKLAQSSFMQCEFATLSAHSVVLPLHMAQIDRLHQPLRSQQQRGEESLKGLQLQA